MDALEDLESLVRLNSEILSRFVKASEFQQKKNEGVNDDSLLNPWNPANDIFCPLVILMEKRIDKLCEEKKSVSNMLFELNKELKSTIQESSIWNERIIESCVQESTPVLSLDEYSEVTELNDSLIQTYNELSKMNDKKRITSEAIRENLYERRIRIRNFYRTYVDLKQKLEPKVRNLDLLNAEICLIEKKLEEGSIIQTEEQALDDELTELFMKTQDFSSEFERMSKLGRVLKKKLEKIEERIESKHTPELTESEKKVKKLAYEIRESEAELDRSKKKLEYEKRYSQEIFEKSEARKNLKKKRIETDTEFRTDNTTNLYLRKTSLQFTIIRLNKQLSFVSKEIQTLMKMRREHVGKRQKPDEAMLNDSNHPISKLRTLCYADPSNPKPLEITNSDLLNENYELEKDIWETHERIKLKSCHLEELKKKLNNIDEHRSSIYKNKCDIEKQLKCVTAILSPSRKNKSKNNKHINRRVNTILLRLERDKIRSRKKIEKCIQEVRELNTVLFNLKFEVIKERMKMEYFRSLVEREAGLVYRKKEYMEISRSVAKEEEEMRIVESEIDRIEEMRRRVSNTKRMELQEISRLQNEVTELRGSVTDGRCKCTEMNDEMELLRCQSERADGQWRKKREEVDWILRNIRELRNEIGTMEVEKKKRELKLERTRVKGTMLNSRYCMNKNEVFVRFLDVVKEEDEETTDRDQEETDYSTTESLEYKPRDEWKKKNKKRKFFHFKDRKIRK